MYAISERLLGVEPLWWWTDTHPPYKGRLTLSPSDINYSSGEPVLRDRGVFPNDEDLLGGFTPDPLGQSTFSTDTWDKMIEATLRLGYPTAPLTPPH